MDDDDDDGDDDDDDVGPHFPVISPPPPLLTQFIQTTSSLAFSTRDHDRGWFRHGCNGDLRDNTREC